MISAEFRKKIFRYHPTHPQVQIFSKKKKIFFLMILKRYSTQNFMLIPNMSVSARSFLGRKHALMAPVLSLHF